MKATDEMKQYLNSIINKIDADIHNELWNKLLSIIHENEQLKNCNLQNVSAFDATDLWNKALRLSVLETNGYWKALRDLEKIGVIKLADMTVD